MKKLGKLSIIIKIYLLVLSIFFTFRLILFVLEMSRLSFASETIKNIFISFFTGLRFDLVVTGYVMFLPILVLLILDLLKKESKIILKIIYYWILILFSVEFLISAADIPYFQQFFSRFSIGAFEWADSPLFVLKMIIEEPKYIIHIFPFIVIIIIFVKFLKKIFTKNSGSLNLKLIYKIPLYLGVLFIVFLSIRGRIEKKSPIRVGTAYFCNDPFLNQLGLNPTFTFLNSAIYFSSEKNKAINLIDEKTAIENVRKYLKITNPIDSISPIAREIIPDTILQEKPNIVLIIMESMSMAKTKRGGCKDDLTPFLDSLSYQSYFFSNIYTAGEHTYNGVFGTLFSMPAIYRQHPMKIIKKFSGISTSLKKLGYSTTYFTTHDGQFDNIEGFLRANDFDNVVSQKDYPEEEVKTTLGVPDDFMFRFSIPYINKLAKNNKPFFVSFMTASDHGPYYIPKYFKPKSKQIKKQIVEYADWSLKRFLRMAEKTKWFENTVFVFIADHGAALKVKYPVALNYHHSPFIVYYPKKLKPKEFDKIGGQIDVYPTIMGIIKQKYINNTLGIDLINENRKYIYFNADDKLAVMDKEFLLIYDKINGNKLYKLNVKKIQNCINDYPEKAKDMILFLESNMQVAQLLNK